MSAVQIPLALYVHLPWCVRKCPYCDFNSHQLKSALPEEHYIDVLLRDFELELPLIAGRSIDTVFFGGGTPSLFKPEAFERLLCGCRAMAPFARDAEITMEANPGTIEHGRFAEYRSAGINRVSLGAQTFSPKALERLGRIHGPEEIYRAVAEVRTAGIDNYNLDLMYALPEQDLEQALNDVRIACDLGPTHLSHYQLTLEPGTVFASQPPPLPDDDSAWQMQMDCQEVLALRGFAQYEVSAYAQPGARCRHNLNYWSFGDYVGIGAGAHGKLSMGGPARVLRTVKPKQPRTYQEAVRVAAAPVGERHEVSRAEIGFEYMLNALRLNNGFETQMFNVRTGLSLSDLEAPLIEAKTRGLMIENATGWRATELGRRFLNDLQVMFLQ